MKGNNSIRSAGASMRSGLLDRPTLQNASVVPSQRRDMEANPLTVRQRNPISPSPATKPEGGGKVADAKAFRKRLAADADRLGGGIPSSPSQSTGKSSQRSMLCIRLCQFSGPPAFKTDAVTISEPILGKWPISANPLECPARW